MISIPESIFNNQYDEFIEQAKQFIGTYWNEDTRAKFKEFLHVYFGDDEDIEVYVDLTSNNFIKRNKKMKVYVVIENDCDYRTIVSVNRFRESAERYVKSHNDVDQDKYVIEEWDVDEDGDVDEDSAIGYMDEGPAIGYMNKDGKLDIEFTGYNEAGMRNGYTFNVKGIFPGDSSHATDGVKVFGIENFYGKPPFHPW